MKACYTHEMRAIDKAAEELGGIPGIVLMENAGIACVKRLEDIGLNGKRVAVFCGKGNNGGDGFVIARHLINKGIDTSVFLVCASEFSGDALVNYEILSKMGADISEILDDDNLKDRIRGYDIVVDAVFGTGIRGKISGIAESVIEAINSYAKFVLSVDIPSGVNGDDGSIAGVCVKADVTVTFGAYKIGMLSFPGADFTGRVFVENISIPEYIMEHININVIDKTLAKRLMPKRYDNSHKGNYGKVFIVGGSRGMTGAPAMSAEAALKCGCGLVSVGVAESLNNIMEVKLTEAMTYPLSEENGNLTLAAAAQIIDKAEECDVLIFGPGIGRAPEITDILREILRNVKIPVIIDADGLYALSKDMDMLSECSCDLIFTPHEMEFSRISGYSLEEIQKNRLKLAEQFCSEYGVTLILKGSKTIVTAPDAKQYINITGNNGMATGGSGDVLAGMAGAFIARGCRDWEAAVLGVYCHGLAGDAAAERFGKDSLTASDIISAIHLILPVE